MRKNEEDLAMYPHVQRCIHYNGCCSHDRMRAKLLAQGSELPLVYREEAEYPPDLTIEERLVYEIVGDLKGRRVIGAEWNGIDRDVQEEILTTWIAIASRHFPK